MPGQGIGFGYQVVVPDYGIRSRYKPAITALDTGLQYQVVIKGSLYQGSEGTRVHNQVGVPCLCTRSWNRVKLPGRGTMVGVPGHVTAGTHHEFGGGVGAAGEGLLELDAVGGAGAAAGHWPVGLLELKALLLPGEGGGDTLG